MLTPHNFELHIYKKKKVISFYFYNIYIKDLPLLYFIIVYWQKLFHEKLTTQSSATIVIRQLSISGMSRILTTMSKNGFFAPTHNLTILRWTGLKSIN